MEKRPRAKGRAVPPSVKVDLINFDERGEPRSFEKGRFHVYRVGPAIVGRATYEPGWRWSEHTAPTGELLSTYRAGSWL
jgi:hypothetical protein